MLELWSGGRTAGWHVTDLSPVAPALPARRLSGYAFDRQAPSTSCTSARRAALRTVVDRRLACRQPDRGHRGDPPCGPDVIAGYTFEAQQTQHVVCIGVADAHIHELWWGSADRSGSTTGGALMPA